MIVSCDVETRSPVDLKTQGAYKYFDQADVLCLCYSINEGPIQLWTPGDPVPDCFEHAERITAWNAAFERLAFSQVLTPRYGFPPIELERWFCTAYQSRCNNMPGALGNAARCLGTKDQKDPIGERLIKQLCIPQPDGSFNNDPNLLEQLYSYCKKDVLAEMAIARQLRMLTDTELEDWHVSERMNDMGIKVDVELCKAAMQYAKDEELDLLDRVADITQGAVTKVRGERIKAWIVDRLDDEHVALITENNKVSMDKRARERLLEADVEAEVRGVIECMDAIGKSSVGKFRAMRNRASADGRVRGVMVAAGAAQTGRASSMGIQIQNFPRETAKDPLAVRADMIANVHPEELAGDSNVMSVLSSMLRPAILPEEGNIFLDADYSSIENRILPWLSESEGGEQKLDRFRAGEDLYLVAASAIYNRDIQKSDPERQVGKIAELSLGFGGGSGAFGAMARGYGIDLPESEVRDIVNNWRIANQWAVEFWSELEIAFTKAYRNQGEWFHAGRVSYVAHEDVLAGGITVFCQLPCGRLLTYPSVMIESNEYSSKITYLRANWIPKAGERQWPRAKLWHGTLAENVTQATAASLMRWALRQLHAEGACVVAAIHDQALVECPLDEADHWEAVLHKAMNSNPDWAEGLPIEAEVDRRTRFGK